jgi:hypothetical protein
MGEEIKESLWRSAGRSVARDMPFSGGRGTCMDHLLCQHCARCWDSKLHCQRESEKDSDKDSSLAET